MMIRGGSTPARICSVAADAVQPGHPDVHEHQVGAQLLGQPDGLVPVPRGAHHLDVGFGVQDRAQPGQYQ